MGHARRVLAVLVVGAAGTAFSLSVGAVPAGAVRAVSPWVGTYTTQVAIQGAPAIGGFILDPKGTGSVATSSDMLFWSASDHVITISILLGSMLSLHLSGHWTRYGIATAKHPGTARLAFSAYVISTAPFFAQRTTHLLPAVQRSCSQSPVLFCGKRGVFPSRMALR